ncbi:MAG: hypothetical protein WBD28_02745, partial [Candidatus Zixiibacteriota bacterium]
FYPAEIDNAIFEDVYRTPNGGKTTENNSKLNLKPFQGDWRVAHLHAINHADAVIAIGGSTKGTSTSIYSAEVMKRAVILIPIFGGAAREAWGYFHGRYYTDIEANQLQSFKIEKDPTWGSEVVKIIESLAHRNSLSQKGLVLTSVIAICSIVGWAYLFSTLDNAISKQLFVWLLLTCASICGSMFRIILRNIGTFQSKWSTTHPIVSVVAGLILGFGFILLAQGANLSLNGTTIQLDTLEEAKRVGGTLSLLLFSCSLFLEAAWRALSQKLAKYFNEV